MQTEFSGDMLAKPVKRMFAAVKSALTVANHKQESSHSHSNATLLFLMTL
jgi:hypothetical protein